MPCNDVISKQSMSAMVALSPPRHERFPFEVVSRGRDHVRSGSLPGGELVASAHGKKGFSLVELLVVIAIMMVLMGLAIPAIRGTRGDVTKAAYTISGVLEQARTYAIANNTYVWVGFFEEDVSAASAAQSAQPGTGRVVISVVASKDGTRYSDALVDSSTPPAFGTEPPTTSPARNQVALLPISKLIRLDNMHMGSLNDGTATNRPPVKTEYQVGDPGFAMHVTSGSSGSPVTNPTTFNYPLAAAGSTPQYTFVKIIEFNSQGEASKIAENTFSGPGLQDGMEIALQPTHGSAIDSGFATQAAAAIQVEGITGRVKIFRP